LTGQAMDKLPKKANELKHKRSTIHNQTAASVVKGESQLMLIIRDMLSEGLTSLPPDDETLVL